MLLEAANQVCNEFDTIGSKGSEVYLLELGESSVNWQVRVFAQPNSYWPIKQAITEAVKLATLIPKRPRTPKTVNTIKV